MNPYNNSFSYKKHMEFHNEQDDMLGLVYYYPELIDVNDEGRELIVYHFLN